MLFELDANTMFALCIDWGALYRKAFSVQVAGVFHLKSRTKVLCRAFHWASEIIVVQLGAQTPFLSSFQRESQYE